MKNIDQSYLYNLVVKTRNGSSNAFAELFAAVYQRHYISLAYMLEDDEQIVRVDQDGLAALAEKELRMCDDILVCRCL